MAKAVVYRKTRAAGVDLFYTVGVLNPRDEVLDYSLIELMQDVGSDGDEDVGVGEVLPEGVVDRLDANLSARLRKGKGTLIEGSEGIEDLGEVSEWSRSICRTPEIISMDVALRALAVLAAHDEELLGIVANISGEDWMSATNDTIAASKVHTTDTDRSERCKYARHTGMEQIGEGTTSSRLVGDVKKATSGEIGEKNLSAARRLAADVLGQITECHVHRICALIPYECKLRLI